MYVYTNMYVFACVYITRTIFMNYMFLLNETLKSQNLYA